MDVRASGCELGQGGQLMETRRFGQKTRPLAQLSFLDFAGEVYRKAFGTDGSDDTYDTALLKSHVKEADVLIVLVDLGKIINGAEDDERTIEANCRFLRSPQWTRPPLVLTTRR